MNLKELLGKKVVITRGMKERHHEHHCMWVAGCVPIGAVGTVHIEDNQYHIVWDDPKYKALEGYRYAITEDSDFIQRVEDV